jgi:type II secretory pathway component PulF
VLPIFRDMFADFALQLPELTRGVLGVGWFLTSRVGLIVGVIILALVAALVLRRRLLPARTNSRFTDWYDKRFRRSAVISRFARFAAELIQAGVEPAAAMRLAAQTTRLPEPSAPAPASGAGPLNYAELVKPKFAPPISATVTYAATRDMLPATRARLLKEVSNCFADQSRLRASVMQGLFGPLAVCFVGGCVLVVVLALFLPLVELINNLSG